MHCVIYALCYLRHEKQHLLHVIFSRDLIQSAEVVTLEVAISSYKTINGNTK